MLSNSLKIYSETKNPSLLNYIGKLGFFVTTYYSVAAMLLY